MTTSSLSVALCRTFKLSKNEANPHLQIADSIEEVPLIPLSTLLSVANTNQLNMDTDTKTSGGAAAKVFYNFELLENILIHGALTSSLNNDTYRTERFRDLYRFQRVNATFRDIIGRSKVLREMMFTTEANDETTGKVAGLENLKFELNPLVNCFPYLGVPLGPSFFPGVHVHRNGANFVPGSVTELRNMELFAKDFEMKSADKSWRRMLLVNKPIEVLVQLEIRRNGRTSYQTCGLDEGVTFGEFVDEVLDAVLSYREGRSMGWLEGDPFETSEDEIDSDDSEESDSEDEQGEEESNRQNARSRMHVDAKRGLCIRVTRSV